MATDKGERVGHGWLMKQAKHFTAWLIDPFTLHKQGNHLVAVRSKKRLLFLKEADYHLSHLEVSPLRKFKSDEFAEIVSSELAGQLDDEFKLGHVKCFDLRFGPPSDERTMVVFGPYLETTENLHRVMKEYMKRLPEPHAYPSLSDGLTIETLLGPQPTTPLARIQEAVYESDDPRPVVISTRLTMPVDGFLLDDDATNTSN